MAAMLVKGIYYSMNGGKMSKYLFVPHSKNISLPGTICSGEIHYQINNQNYKTLENIEDKIRNLCILIVSKNTCAVGLGYDCEIHDEPVIIIKEEKYGSLIKLCKKHKVVIKYNKNLAEQILISCEKNERLSEGLAYDLWYDVAVLFGKIAKKDNSFKEKINHMD